MDKRKACDKARECLWLTGGKVICPEGDYCALYDEIGGGTLERVLFPQEAEDEPRRLTS
jgi:hypothetical protein